MPREILVAEAAGFCFGVKKAIQKAESMDQAFIFGSLIHNPQEVERLSKMKKHIVHALEEIDGNQVVITAHGLDIKKIEEMKSKNFDIIDTTCPLVTRIYKEGWKLESQGFQIVIIGDPNHVEVKGIASRMKNPIIVYEESDLIGLKPHAKIGVICQSTLLLEKFDKFVHILQGYCDQVVAINTICKPTKDRQTSAALLAQQVDLMIVIGGRNSSNTHKLAQTCQTYLPLKTFHVETASELQPQWFHNQKKVGITAGASTPDYLIQECIEKIQSFDLIVPAS